MAVLVIGGHILDGEGDGDGLGLARLEELGLLVADEVGAGLLDAAIGIGRVEVDLDDVLAGDGAGVGDGYIEADLAVGLGDLAHLLLEASVGEAVAEGVLHGGIVVDDALGGGGLVELVAHVDVLNVVDEGGRVVGGNAGVHAFDGHVKHVGIVGLLGVVVVRSGIDVVHEGVVGLARGVHGAGEDLAQRGEAHVAGAGSPHEGLDLRELLDEAELEGIGAVVDHDDVVEVGADELDHVALGLGELQIVVAGLPVVVCLGVVLEGGLAHILRDIGVTLAGEAADHDDGGVGVILGSVDELIGVVGSRRLRKVPVLGRDRDGRTALGIAEVEVDEILVDLEARVLKAIDEAHDWEQAVDAAGAGTAVDGVGGGPAEEVELGALGKRELALVLEQDEAFLGDVERHRGSLVCGLLGNLAAARNQADERGHGPEADHIHHDGDGSEGAEPRSLADERALCLGLALDRDGDDDRSHDEEPDGDQIGRETPEDADKVFHLK